MILFKLERFGSKRCQCARSRGRGATRSSASGVGNQNQWNHQICVQIVTQNGNMSLVLELVLHTCLMCRIPTNVCTLFTQWQNVNE